MAVKLTDVAEVIRSKNSGPYELTFDIIFKDWEVYHKACAAKAITPDTFYRLYRVPVSDVISFVEFTPAKALKATIVRPFPSGDVGETDVYGAQQHAPLLNLSLDI